MAENEVKEAKEAKGASAPAAQAREPQKGKKPQRKEEKAVASIVRLAGRDIDGSLGVERALSHVKGIGQNMAHSLSFAIEGKFGITKNTPVSTLSEEQIEKIETVIKNPLNYGIPLYSLNRRKDPETGKDVHVVSNDLLFSTRQDINRDQTIKSWRGFRHQYGQKVRGQHTRSTGRTGTTVGVMKKAAVAAGAAPAAGAAKPAAAPGPAAAPKAEKK